MMLSEIKKYGVIGLLTCIAIVWRNSILLLVLKYVVPIMQVVPQHSWLVQIVLLIAVLVWYAMNYKSIVLEENIWQRRYENIFILIIAYLYFRLSTTFSFYGIRDDVCYIDICCIEIGIIEIFLLGYRILKSRTNKIQQSECQPFYVDSPVSCSTQSDGNDWYQRSNYARLLLEKIIATYQTNQKSENAFTILLNERYGIGKTSFFNRFEIIAKERNIDVMWFKPWLNSGEDRLIMHFFDTLRSKLDADDHALTRLLKIYSKVTTQPLGKSTSQELLAIFSPSYSLDDMHKNIAERLRKRKKPLLVLVDDVDRLLPLEMLSLLRLIRNTADFPNMVYLVAADKVAMTEALYSQHIENPVLYLEKFFNYEFLFPSNEERIKDALLLHLVICLGKYGFDEERQSNARYYMESYRYIKEVFKSPRDIKRYMNILSFSLDGMKANGIINDVYLPDLLAICLIQYLDESIYKILRDANETLLSFSTISEVYTLKTEYEEASRSRQEALDTLQWLKEKTDTKEQPKFEYKDLRQTLTEQSTSVNLIVAKLLYDLFNSHTGRGTHRISYALEYFKYFAGHYRSNELSNAQANAIWGMTIQEFDIYIIQTIASDSYASLMHKFDLFITTEGHNKLEMLQKLLFVYNRVADIEIKKIPRCDAYSYYSRYGEAQYKIMKLYSYEYAIPTSIADCENADLSEYFMRNNNFMNLAMTLLALRRIDKTRYSTSFTDEMRQTWEENIIRRFFNEVFVKEFLNHLETMPFIRELDPMEYKSCFLEIIAKSKNPLDWIFCCVGRKGTHYQWKENIMHSLFEDNINKFRESISLYMRPFMNATIAADFDELLSDNKMSKASLNDHPFLQAWEDWIAEKEIS